MSDGQTEVQEQQAADAKVAERRYSQPIIFYTPARWDRELRELDYRIEVALTSGDHDSLRIVVAERLAVEKAMVLVFGERE